MLSKITDTLSRSLDRLVQRYVPDPFVIALLLTFFVLLAGWVFTPTSWDQVVLSWGDGFWSLLTFTLQMVMVLVGGFVVADSAPVSGFLKKISQLPRTAAQAILLVTLASCLASWINWGLGLVVGALLAVEVAKAQPRVSFRALVASAYGGFIVWHGGFSASIPLVVNTPGNFSEKWIGGVISTSETIFSSLNLVALLATVLVLVGLNLKLGLSYARESQALDFEDDSQVSFSHPSTPAEKLDSSRFMILGIFLIGLTYFFLLVRGGSFQLNLNTVNFIFILLGLILHKTPRAYLHSLGRGASKVGPLLIQYPIYAGIMGVMVHSGLAEGISNFFIQLSSAESLALWTFYSAGLVNLLIPSGGGQWAIQAPIVIPAALELGADLPKVIMAVAWGDAWTNLAQPFWALPLLSIAGLKIRDILAHCLILLVGTGIVLSLVFYI